MEQVDILRDLLQYRISNQEAYNRHILEVKNPELRQVFTEFRDDETRSIVWLQQKIARMEAPPGIISKIYTSRQNY